VKRLRAWACRRYGHRRVWAVDGMVVCRRCGHRRPPWPGPGEWTHIGEDYANEVDPDPIGAQPWERR
jgi:hypothetical protein